jgi:hypothetical protein
MRKLLNIIWVIILTILKWTAKAALTFVNIVLEAMKLFLLLLSLVARVVFAFVKIATP